MVTGQRSHPEGGGRSERNGQRKQDQRTMKGWPGIDFGNHHRSEDRETCLAYGEQRMIDQQHRVGIR